MKLSSLYCNLPDKFHRINFSSGLNIVLGEIRLPENKNRDTHNLGKSTLSRVLDFCLLVKRNQSLFLFKHFERFKEFEFFLELELLSGEFLTIKRCVNVPSRISFKKHKEKHLDLTRLLDNDWDHHNVPFKKSKELLDGLLDLSAFQPWAYRKGIGYFLRSQYDYSDVFQLRKFSGKQSEWKPFLAHLVGFDGILVQEHYSKEQELESKEHKAAAKSVEVGGATEELSQIDGLLLLKRADLERQQKLLDSFDFGTLDTQRTEGLIENIDLRISELNSTRYRFRLDRRRISEALDSERILFTSEQAKQLFEEAGVLFEGQLQRDYSQLVNFNDAITSERRAYLQEELSEIENELTEINQELLELTSRRDESLKYLNDTDVIAKYKVVSEELSVIRTDILTLERRKVANEELQSLRGDIRQLTEDKDRLQDQVREDVRNNSSNQSSFYSTLRIHFSDIIRQVLDRNALLNVRINKNGHLEFDAEILDESGNSTSQGVGNTYRKLLCIAFDLAMIRARHGENFPRFVFHDGILEALDDRKKENLFDVIRQYEGYGIQHIVTLIDSDLPQSASSGKKIFDESEIALLLHDEGEEGRLFKMPTW